MKHPTNLETALLQLLTAHTVDSKHGRVIPDRNFQHLIPEMAKFIEAGHEAEFLRGKFEGFEDGLKINGDLNSR